MFNFNAFVSALCSYPPWASYLMEESVIVSSTISGSNRPDYAEPEPKTLTPSECETKNSLFDGENSIEWTCTCTRLQARLVTSSVFAPGSEDYLCSSSSSSSSCLLKSTFSFMPSRERFYETTNFFSKTRRRVSYMHTYFELPPPRR
jgi:hypothetical protein